MGGLGSRCSVEGAPGLGFRGPTQSSPHRLKNAGCRSFSFGFQVYCAGLVFCCGFLGLTEWPRISRGVERFVIRGRAGPQQAPILYEGYDVCTRVCMYIRVLVCLFVCLSVGQSVCLSVCLSVCPSVCLSVCLSVCDGNRVFSGIKAAPQALQKDLQTIFRVVSWFRV